MLRLVFIILIFVAAALGWTVLQNYDFPITLELKGYEARTSMAKVSVLLLIVFILLYFFLKTVIWVKNSPKRFMAKLRKENEENGYKNILSGFSALAAGDVSRAKKLSDKAAKALPDENLVKLLQAQTAKTAGEKDLANRLFTDLTQTEEGKFIGFRGLISEAIDSNQPQKALEIADNLLKDSPKSVWLNSALIDLGFRNQDWDKLERYLRKAEANRAIDKAELAEKFAVFYYIKATIAKQESRVEDAVWLAERALKYNNDFLPAAIFLSGILIESGELKKARSIIEKQWKNQTHPLLAKYYDETITVRGGKNRLKQIKKLFDLAPEDIESIAVYARLLITEGQKTEARELLEKAQKLRETRAVCQLMAQIDDRVAWQNRAATAPEDKCWHCRLTGARYPDWQLYSESGELNTIVWDYPPESAKVAFGTTKYLLLS